MKNLKTKKTISLFLFALAILVMMFIIVSNKNEKPPKGEVTSEAEKIDWRHYKNDEYSFELDFPANWHIYEDFTGPTVTINFYKKTPNTNPPFDHFSSTPNFSVFPLGIPKEGIVGKKNIVKDTPILNNSKTMNFILENGEIWSKMISFNKTPPSWKEWGFVWVRNEVSDYDEKCFREEKEVSVYECNIFQGDEIRRFGDVNQKIIDINDEIIESFHFNN